LNYLAMLVMAIYRPRLYIVDAGNSFGLLGAHFKQHGVTVNQVTLNPNTDVSLPPFADAYTMLAQMKRPNLSVAVGETPEDLPELDDEDPTTRTKTATSWAKWRSPRGS
jgi:hypothetical protein